MGRREREHTGIQRTRGAERTRLHFMAVSLPMSLLVLVSALGAWPRVALCLARGDLPVINEVLYDPPGKDAGFEFVEIFNPGDRAVSLGGWRLETGNGSSENRWTLEWTGANTDVVGPQEFFVIGEEAVSPRPDAVTDLDLQNGPDACRLVSPAGEADVVGWGDHVYPEYYEGGPVLCSASGVSIGRDPDGRDTDDNGVDFKCLEAPSPSDFNHPRCDLAVAKAGLSRYASGSGVEIDLVCVILNLGSDACGEGAEVSCEVGSSVGAATLDDAIQPEAASKSVLRLPNPGPGLHATRVIVRCSEDSHKANDTLATSVVVPPPPVVINEVMSKPLGKDCEWLEVLNHSASALSLEDWTFEDSGGKPRRITNRGLSLEPGAYAVLVENEAAFSGAYGESSQVVYFKPAGGWPTLNDVEGPFGFADAIVLRDGFGTSVDSMAYGERWARPGFSIERISPDGPSGDPANWSPHYGGPGGSPGRRNSVSFFLPQGEDILRLSPSTFTPDGDGQDDLVAISVCVSRPSSVRLRVFDVAGRPVRHLVNGDLVEARRLTFWDGADDAGARLPVGVYIVAVETRLEGSDRTLEAKSPVVLTRR